MGVIEGKYHWTNTEVIHSVYSKETHSSMEAMEQLLPQAGKMEDFSIDVTDIGEYWEVRINYVKR